MSWDEYMRLLDDHVKNGTISEIQHKILKEIWSEARKRYPNLCEPLPVRDNRMVGWYWHNLSLYIFRNGDIAWVFYINDSSGHELASDTVPEKIYELIGKCECSGSA